MTEQFVVFPHDLETLSRVFADAAGEFEATERRLRYELAAVRLNPADPWFSAATFSARAGTTHRVIRHCVRLMSDEAGDVDDARRQAESADSPGSRVARSAVGDFLIDYILGDVAAFWGRHRDGFVLAPMATGAIRVLRTGVYLAGGVDHPRFPVFNTGFVGRQLSTGLQRVPRLAGAGSWLGSPAATTFFRRAGIAGAVVGTGYGSYGLYQQGNPIDAFEREGAGYVADVANTAFSASTAAFLIAPNPVTGALVIGTGAVWLGAEVVDNWDTISQSASDAWDAGTDLLADGAGALVDGAGSVVSGVGGFVSDWF